MEQNLQVVNKGYELNLEKIQEGYLFSPVACSAPTRGAAKIEILKSIRLDDVKLANGEETTYLNLPIRRSKNYDVVLFEGGEVTRHEVDTIKAYRKRMEHLNSLLDNPEIQYCYILKGGSYYAPNNCGYTQFKFSAGVYTKEEAVLSARSCEELRLEPISIEEHNLLMRDKIKDLESRIIQPA
jgi:hypothetical protein